MGLQERLDRQREAMGAKLSDDIKAKLGQSAQEIAAMGMLDRAAKVGDKAIDFTLPDADGNMVNLNDMLAKGPVILGFSRGKW